MSIVANVRCCLSQVAKLQQERSALVERMQGTERRDRLAELCRRQALAGAKAASELRQQLAERDQQLQSQCMAAAAAEADAARLRDQLAATQAALERAQLERDDGHDAGEPTHFQRCCQQSSPLQMHIKHPSSRSSFLRASYAPVQSKP